ncbi:uncharacterized protein [Macrobrachium rosenbergii]|uniref:uncharacterized protein n=1 Tax=Macrobrachium rosenbergii TaxID=79674 RepID=UPI0034D4CF6E
MAAEEPRGSKTVGFYVRNTVSGRMMLVDTGAFKSIFPASRQDRNQTQDLAAFLTAANGTPILAYGTRGPAFLSELWSALAQLLGTRHHTTTTYNPAANGQVERFHRSLKSSLMARCTAEDWKHQLLWVLLGLRTAPRADGTPSAAEQTYGEPLVVPGELLYRGPFHVLERNSKAFRLALPGKDDWVSIDRLKPAFLSESPDSDAAPLPPNLTPARPHPCRRVSPL